MNEPEKKDGIWIKTNNQYEHILINQKYSNYQSGVWSSDTPVPYGNYNAVCNISYNNAIYAIQDIIYTYSNGVWTRHMFTIPQYTMNGKAAAIYNDKLYLASDHVVYVYDNINDLTTYKSIPINYEIDSDAEALFIYNNSVYCMGYGSPYMITYKINTNTDTATKINNYVNRCDGNWIDIGIINGHIYVLYGWTLYLVDNIDDMENTSIHAKLTIPGLSGYKSTPGGVCFKDNMMHIFYDKYHYVTDGNTLTQICTLPNNHSHYYSNGCVFHGDIHLIGGNTNRTYEATVTDHIKFQSPEKVYSPNTLIINRGNSNSGVYLTAINDNSEIIKGNNNRFVSGFDDCFYFADSAFDWTAPMYYGDGSRWIKFKN